MAKGVGRCARSAWRFSGDGAARGRLARSLALAADLAGVDELGGVLLADVADQALLLAVQIFEYRVQSI